MAFPLIGVLSAIVAPFTELGKLWLEKKKVQAEGAVRVEVAKTEGEVKRLQTAQEQEGSYNIAAQEGMKYSWKDEWLTILWSIPFIACFFPEAQPYVKEGFEVLKNNTPEWYQWGFLGILVASFGLKGWNFFTRKAE
jgi:hypothetical protein